VPVAVVKQRYGAKLEEDANSEALRELYSASLKDLGLEQGDIIGEPAITKFDKKDDSSIDVQINISCKPAVDLGDYKALLPKIKLPEVTDKEVDDRIKEIASSDAPLEKIKRKRAVKSGDFAVIDFEGFKDGIAFEGGKAEKYTLEIGSNSFIPGFEDQVIGMKYDEEKEINVTFPKEYQSKDLAGADVVFKVKLHEIQAKAEPTIDDEFAKKLLPQEENATVELLKEKIKEQIENVKISKYYAEELKPVYLDTLVEKIDFAVPSSILDQEIQQVINGEVRNMSEDEIKALQEDASKIEEMKKEATPVATQSVKATFIIDALAKAEGIDVTDQEVTQTIYYEAMMSGQDGQAMIKQYEEAGYLPAIKMSMMEQKVINKLLDEKAGRN
jgi:trigger factor